MSIKHLSIFIISGEEILILKCLRDMISDNKPCFAPTTYSCAGDAVGVPEKHWFVAILNNNSEKSVASKLKSYGVECYLPVQSEIHVWKNGKKAKVDRVVIPSVIFIRCSEKERKDSLVSFPFINRFMTNRAAATLPSGNKPLAIIPDDQIRRLMFMLGQADCPVNISQFPIKRGDRVKVIRGSLAGLEGIVADLKSSKSELVVNIDFLGCARVSIDTFDLEIIRH